MTWSTEPEKGWPYEELKKYIDTVNIHNPLEIENWRMSAFKEAKIGLRVFAFRQGSDPRGIFGIGHIAGQPFYSNTIVKKKNTNRWFAPVQFSSLVDPTKRLLLKYEDFFDLAQGNKDREREIENLRVRQSSGTRIPPEIEKLLNQHFRL